MKKLFSDKSGFTLVEIIAVLVIAGVLSVFAIYGISLSVKAFMFSKDASNTMGKGQVAMMRMTKEFKNIFSVSSGSTTAISYKMYRDRNDDGDADAENHTLSWEGNTLFYEYGDEYGDEKITLVDGVSDFKLRYFYFDSSNVLKETSSWNQSTTTTRIIEVTMSLSAGETSSDFTARIVPRNIP